MSGLLGEHQRYTSRCGARDNSNCVANLYRLHETDYIFETLIYSVRSAHEQTTIVYQEFKVQKIDVSVTKSKHDLSDKHVQIEFIVGRTNLNFNTLNKG